MAYPLVLCDGKLRNVRHDIEQTPGEPLRRLHINPQQPIRPHDRTTPKSPVHEPDNSDAEGERDRELEAEAGSSRRKRYTCQSAMTLVRYLQFSS